MTGTCTIRLISMASIYWWPLSNFISNFANYTSYPSRTCIIRLASKAFTLQCTQSLLSDFDWYIAYFQTNKSGLAPSEPRWLPSIDAHRHGWVILSRISLTLNHILVLSDLPRRLSCSDEQSHGWVILSRISLTLNHILVLSDLPRRLSCSDEQSHGWVILTRISLILNHILVLSDFHGLVNKVTVEWFYLVFRSH